MAEWDEKRIEEKLTSAESLDSLERTLRDVAADLMDVSVAEALLAGLGKVREQLSPRDYLDLLSEITDALTPLMHRDE